MKNTKEEWDQVDPYNVEDYKFWVKLEHLGPAIPGQDQGKIVSKSGIEATIA